MTWRRNLAEEILARKRSRQLLSMMNFWSYQIDMESPSARLEQERALVNLAHLLPWGSESLDLQRVGGTSDGGYVMSQGWSSATAAISIGIGAEDSWDFAVAEQGIPVWQFDHTIHGPPREHALLTWVPQGLGAESAVDPSLLTFERIVDLCPSSGDLLLQVDIEGAEWQGLAQADFSRFSQIVIELHLLHRLGKEEHFDEANQMLGRLTRDHRVVHVHPNNCCGLRMVAGLAIPPVLEVTLVRADFLVDPVRISASAPTSLDRPNVPQRPEIYWTNPAETIV